MLPCSLVINAIAISTTARLLAWLAAGLVVAASAVAGENIAYGIVSGVVDGDTCFVVINGQATRIRLDSIDAPEKKQAFGRRAEQALRELVAKKQVEVRWTSSDRYGRLVARLKVAGVDVNAELVRNGFAWVYRKYSRDAELLALEAQAREARRGLWADPHRVEPWTWRSRQRASQLKQSPKAPNGA